jgi:hypothetical protein
VLKIPAFAKRQNVTSKIENHAINNQAQIKQKFQPQKPTTPTPVPTHFKNLIQKAYPAFNSRDINTALSTFHENVE